MLLLSQHPFRKGPPTRSQGGDDGDHRPEEDVDVQVDLLDHLQGSLKKGSFGKGVLHGKNRVFIGICTC